MAVNYIKLVFLIDKDMKKPDLRTRAKISSSAVVKGSKGEKVYKGYPRQDL
jgi:DNA-binding Xre family transcriptional regulator